MRVTVRSNRNPVYRHRRARTDTYQACREMLNGLLSKKTNVKTVAEFTKYLNKIANDAKTWKAIEELLEKLDNAKMLIEEVY